MNHLKPYSTNNDIKYLIVDIGEILDEIKNLDQLQIIFNKFPIKDIISFILAIKQERDYSSLLYDELEDRLEELIDNIDLYIIDVFVENLITNIDNCIYSKLPTYIDPSEYIFDNWINNNVIIMKRTT